MKDDRWLTRLRALAGLGTLGWELGVEHGHQWWIFILVLYLLGAPFEDLVRLFTSGRVQINIRKDEKDHPEEQDSDPGQRGS